MIGNHAGYCIGGPWNAQQMADTRDRVVLYSLPPWRGVWGYPKVPNHKPHGEYRWRDGGWIWVPDGEVMK